MKTSSFKEPSSPAGAAQTTATALAERLVMSPDASIDGNNHDVKLTEGMKGSECYSLLSNLYDRLAKFSESLAIKMAYNNSINFTVELKRQKRLVDAVLGGRSKEADTYPVEVVSATIVTILSERAKQIFPRYVL